MLVDKMFSASEISSMCSQCDYVLVATPLTPQTVNLVNAAVIDSMKSTAVLINVGRGLCVDEQALIAALETGGIKGAALDVFATEPLPEASPLWGLENVLLSPHNADFVPTFLEDAFEVVETNLKAFETGDAFTHTVDREIGY